ncbi:MAG: hypothetical protein KAJ86_08355 [Alphaproteobacteria bacterium]|nr:hypothetical protein [Alphaproteobacteria bacterium]
MNKKKHKCEHPLFTLILCLLLSTIIFLAIPCTAQDAQQDKSFISKHNMHGTNFLAEKHYNQLTHDLINNTINFNYGNYRTQYTLSKRYDPIGDIANKTLLDIAYKIQNEQNPEEIKKAQIAYRTHIMNHMANMTVVLQALLLSYEDKRFGNPKFWKKLRNGLLKSVKDSGNGRTLSSAYHIITSMEETMLLRLLRVKIIKTTSSHSGILYYNMHEIEELNTKVRKTIFIDTTQPMDYLALKKRTAPAIFNIRPK